MIIFDFWGHLVSTEGSQELHRFAKKIGLKREWFQEPGYREHHAHYDLTTVRMKEKAEKLGAKQVTPGEVYRRAWWHKWGDREWKKNENEG